jgi:hypothetical protein
VRWTGNTTLWISGGWNQRKTLRRLDLEGGSLDTPGFEARFGLDSVQLNFDFPESQRFLVHTRRILSGDIWRAALLPGS